MGVVAPGSQVTRRSQAFKEDQDAQKAEAMRAKAIATAERMAETERKRVAQEAILSKKIQNEFNTKLALQEAQWAQVPSAPRHAPSQRLAPRPARPLVAPSLCTSLA